MGRPKKPKGKPRGAAFTSSRAQQATRLRWLKVAFERAGYPINGDWLVEHATNITVAEVPGLVAKWRRAEELGRRRAAKRAEKTGVPAVTTPHHEVAQQRGAQSPAAAPGGLVEGPDPYLDVVQMDEKMMTTSVVPSLPKMDEQMMTTLPSTRSSASSSTPSSAPLQPARRCNRCGEVIPGRDLAAHATGCHRGYDEHEARRWRLP